MVSVAVKATFRFPVINNEKSFELHSEKVPIFYQDQLYDKDSNSSIKYPADVVLGKAGTDIFLVGSAYSPNTKPVIKTMASVKVGPVGQTLLITGNRKWEKRTGLVGFTASNPSPFSSMQLKYEFAFGGYDKSEQDSSRRRFLAENPIGSGFVINPNVVDRQPLPNIENPNHLITNWKDSPAVAGFGPISGSWEPRLQYSGTYDSDWERKKMPLLPDDFNIKFFNSAPSALQSRGFLKGGEPVELIGVSPKGSIQFSLPKYDIRLTFRFENRVLAKKALLHTVLFEPDEERFYLVWSETHPVGKQLSQFLWAQVDLEENKINSTMPIEAQK